ncbi:hypothetical protein BB558_006122 [Smittium angustum]|uniref:ATPase AAA-type core domain-containing protein n=1 Tax=Smittium angustum TaxID=133377 RepID=A0A2U1IYK7_SMIAN|nr:hypothetical protein BB558_006122 [Smittium angustum]
MSSRSTEPSFNNIPTVWNSLVQNKGPNLNPTTTNNLPPAQKKSKISKLKKEPPLKHIETLPINPQLNTIKKIRLRYSSTPPSFSTSSPLLSKSQNSTHAIENTKPIEILETNFFTKDGVLNKRNFLSQENSIENLKKHDIPTSISSNKFDIENKNSDSTEKTPISYFFLHSSKKKEIEKKKKDSCKEITPTPTKEKTNSKRQAFSGDISEIKVITESDRKRFKEANKKIAFESLTPWPGEIFGNNEHVSTNILILPKISIPTNISQHNSIVKNDIQPKNKNFFLDYPNRKIPICQDKHQLLEEHKKPLSENNSIKIENKLEIPIVSINRNLENSDYIKAWQSVYDSIPVNHKHLERLILSIIGKFNPKFDSITPPNTKLLTEKYAPSNILEIIGNDDQVENLAKWMKSSLLTNKTTLSSVSSSCSIKNPIDVDHPENYQSDENFSNEKSGLIPSIQEQTKTKKEKTPRLKSIFRNRYSKTNNLDTNLKAADLNSADKYPKKKHTVKKNLKTSNHNDCSSDINIEDSFSIPSESQSSSQDSWMSNSGSVSSNWNGSNSSSEKSIYSDNEISLDSDSDCKDEPLYEIMNRQNKIINVESSFLFPKNKDIPGLEKSQSKGPTFTKTKNLKKKTGSKKSILPKDKKSNDGGEKNEDITSLLETNGFTPEEIEFFFNYKFDSPNQITGRKHVFGSNTKVNKYNQSIVSIEKHDIFDSLDSKQSLGDCGMVLLLGPSGSGKTAAVYAIAREHNYAVHEIHAGELRSGKALMAQLSELVKSHVVSRNSKFFNKSVANPNEIIDLENNGKSSCGSIGEPNQVLILLEQIDILFEQDSGMFAALELIATNSKRPIIATSSSKLNLSGNFGFSKVFEFKMPSIDQLVPYMNLILYNECGLMLNPRIASEVCNLLSCNLWRIMTWLGEYTSKMKQIGCIQNSSFLDTCGFLDLQTKTQSKAIRKMDTTQQSLCFEEYVFADVAGYVFRNNLGSLVYSKPTRINGNCNTPSFQIEKEQQNNLQRTLNTHVYRDSYRIWSEYLNKPLSQSCTQKYTLNPDEIKQTCDFKGNREKRKEMLLNLELLDKYSKHSDNFVQADIMISSKPERQEEFLEHTYLFESGFSFPSALLSVNYVGLDSRLSCNSTQTTASSLDLPLEYYEMLQEYTDTLSYTHETENRVDYQKMDTELMNNSEDILPKSLRECGLFIEKVLVAPKGNIQRVAKEWYGNTKVHTGSENANLDGFDQNGLEFQCDKNGANNIVSMDALDESGNMLELDQNQKNPLSESSNLVEKYVNLETFDSEKSKYKCLVNSSIYYLVAQKETNMEYLPYLLLLAKKEGEVRALTKEGQDVSSKPSENLSAGNTSDKALQENVYNGMGRRTTRSSRLSMQKKKSHLHWIDDESLNHIINFQSL